MTQWKRRHKAPAESGAENDAAADTPETLGPWEMLHEDEIASVSARLREEGEGRSLTAFARRTDVGALACFDRDAAGENKGVVVIFPNGRERAFASFGAWFDAALADAL